MSLTRSESDSRDLTQQTFFIWATKGHQLHDRSKVKTWLYTTLHRPFLQGRRRQTRFPHQDLDEASKQLPAISLVLADRIDSLQVLPALAKVDEVYQAALALFCLEDHTYKDIAADSGRAGWHGQIAALQRGIAQLRDLLANDSRVLPPLGLVALNGAQVPSRCHCVSQP